MRTNPEEASIWVSRSDDATGKLQWRLALNELSVQMVGMLCYALGRMLVFAMFYINIGTRFGHDNIGTLVGVGAAVSALLSLVKYSTIDAASTGSAFLVNIVCGATLAGLLPYCIRDIGMEDFACN